MPGVDFSVPSGTSALAAWLAEGVRAEILELEKAGGKQIHELSSGVLIAKLEDTEAIYEFAILAGGLRIPDEATGTLKTQLHEFQAAVVSQQGDTIRLHLSGAGLGENIYRAELIIDEIWLLRELLAALENPQERGFVLSPLADLVFHAKEAKPGWAELPASLRAADLDEKRSVLEQACGSEVTYIWEPPGTGKTFTLAYLITALIEMGERVLVASHTKAAVDQALYEAVKEDEDALGNTKRGPLAGHSSVRESRVLRLGEISPDSKLPDSVRMQAVLEGRTREIEQAISLLEAQLEPIQKRVALAKQAIAAWQNLDKLAAGKTGLEREIQTILEEQAQAKRDVELGLGDLQSSRINLAKAEKAWFRRATKVQEATNRLRKAEERHASASSKIEELARLLAQTQDTFERRTALCSQQQAICAKLPARAVIQQEIAKMEAQTGDLSRQIAELKALQSDMERRLVTEAKAIFCTLTKNYVGEALKGQTFTAVIVDEISMALPPLIFLAACRATKRVILVGDFCQLPPIVRSEAEAAKERLGTDVFYLTGIVENGAVKKGVTVCPQLRIQRRMRPAIAEVARFLVYGARLIDSEEVRQQSEREEFKFLPGSGLVFVDTTELNVWCGKQAGSLSRFNFYSATVSVDLAAMAAANLQRPSRGSEKPVGIVTPYAAQRKLIRKLVEAAGLGPWIQVGTVHTFQGGQANLVIFDSVLDTPYWGARLTNPRHREEVLRELNVAVTRAKDKFVFVGSSSWLNKHASEASALGHLWSFLKSQADLVSALELVHPIFFARVVETTQSATGWKTVGGDGKVKLQKLDDTTFFPQFAADLRAARHSIFAMAPYFGSHRWPQIEPLFNDGLRRGVEVTIVTPPPAEASNPEYVRQVIKHLRTTGAVVATSSGLHGKDVIIDEKILYTGSMNWSSNRGRLEEAHRVDDSDYAKYCLETVQARHIREKVVTENGSPRICPYCGHPVQIVNQATNLQNWERQALKVGCTNKRCEGYLRPIDERQPFTQLPRCQIDRKTKYHLINKGRGQQWVCPKHPSKCDKYKFVPGDVESSTGVP
jgi:hypothetical protein